MQLNFIRTQIIRTPTIRIAFRTILFKKLKKTGSVIARRRSRRPAINDVKVAEVLQQYQDVTRANWLVINSVNAISKKNLDDANICGESNKKEL